MAESSQSAAHQSVLDVTAQRIARVYAQALLGATAKVNQLDQVVAELAMLVADILEPYPKLEATLTSALVSTEEKEGILDRIFQGRASPHLLSFLKVLARHERLNLIREVVSELHDLYMDHLGKVDVFVRAAKPMEHASQEELRKVLTGRLDATPELHVDVDPSLIAGLIVTVGDTVFDASIATHLAQARKVMIDKAVELIQTKRERVYES